MVDGPFLVYPSTQPYSLIVCILLSSPAMQTPWGLTQGHSCPACLRDGEFGHPAGWQIRRGRAPGQLDLHTSAHCPLHSPHSERTETGTTQPSIEVHGEG